MLAYELCKKFHKYQQSEEEYLKHQYINWTDFGAPSKLSGPRKLKLRKFAALIKSFLHYFCTPSTQDINWTYLRRSEDVQNVFWTSYARSIYVLYPEDSYQQSLWTNTCSKSTLAKLKLEFGWSCLCLGLSHQNISFGYRFAKSNMWVWQRCWIYKTLLWPLQSHT